MTGEYVSENDEANSSSSSAPVDLDNDPDYAPPKKSVLSSSSEDSESEGELWELPAALPPSLSPTFTSTDNEEITLAKQSAEQENRNVHNASTSTVHLEDPYDGDTEAYGSDSDEEPVNILAAYQNVEDQLQAANIGTQCKTRSQGPPDSPLSFKPPKKKKQKKQRHASPASLEPPNKKNKNANRPATRKTRSRGPASPVLSPKRRTSGFNFTSHAIRIHKQKPRIHKCPVCKKSFDCVLDVSCHVRVEHKKFRFQCTFPRCTSDFISDNGLKKHIKAKHTPNTKKFICDVCGKICLYKSHLTEHKRKHRGARAKIFRCLQKGCK